MELVPLTEQDFEAASELCMRSKAFWGYDTAFMAACRPELTLSAQDVAEDDVIVARDTAGLAGVAQVSADINGCFLEKLFVDPARMGQGTGRLLFDWSLSAARRRGAIDIIVEADPGAVPFYQRMGCRMAGTVPSGSIPGRVLPRLLITVP